MTDRLSGKANRYAWAVTISTSLFAESTIKKAIWGLTGGKRGCSSRAAQINKNDVRADLFNIFVADDDVGTAFKKATEMKPL